MNLKEPIIDTALQGELLKVREEFESYLSDQVGSIERMYEKSKTKSEIEQVRRWEEMLIKLKGFFECADNVNKIYANKLIDFVTYYEHLKMNSKQYQEEAVQVYAESIELTDILFDLTGKMEFKDRKEKLVESFNRIDIKKQNALKWL